MENDNIGMRVKLARVAQGLTQLDLAKKTNVNPSQISNLETGKRMPHLETVARIVFGLGLSLDEICGDKQELHVRASPPTMADLESLLFKLGLTEYDVQDVTHMVEGKLERQGKNSGSAATG